MIERVEILGIDLKGKEILPIEYDDIQATLGVKNSLKIQKDGKYGDYVFESKVIHGTADGR